MSVWLTLLSLLCLVCTAVTVSASGGVERRTSGQPITIKCTISELNQEFLELRKGLNEEVQVLYHDATSQKDTISKEFLHRLQVHDTFPTVQILIKNLTTDDTGPYWCLYIKYDPTSHEPKTTKGKGSVLLVVEDKDKSPTETDKPECNPAKDNLVMVSVVISAAVLLSIIMGVLIWLIKTKTANTTRKPRRVTTNDVYEDMRGTFRR